MPREVRGEICLAPAPQSETRKERPVHQRLGRNAREPEREQDEHLPRVKLLERLPDLLVVDELRDEPYEKDDERRNHEGGPEQAPPERPRDR